mmetsp:Transcript_11707/g.17890  ORF Transcript_11707/g.17890 Transcript_11707/m.17890 type:complete len:222 (+) Transcript_11707:2-667(+)
MVPNHSQTDKLVAAISEGKSMHLPVLNMGMPKEGSSTLQDFFKCAGFRASHSQCGNLMQKAAQNGENPLSACNTNWGGELHMQLDISRPPTCYYPQIQLLDEIHRGSPNATFILLFRPVMDWIKSIDHWQDMRKRFVKCDLPGLPEGVGGRMEDMVQWHCGHVQHVREFVAHHPSHALIELDLYDTERNQRVMSTLFNASSECWGHSNINKKLVNKEKQKK